jgi:hypothetical protein
MLSFMDAYTIWRRLPFPRGATGDTLPELKGDLVAADEYVTTVIGFVERGVYKPAVPDVLGLLESILRRVDEADHGLTRDERTVAREIHAYAALLHELYRQFLTLASDG